MVCKHCLFFWLYLDSALDQFCILTVFLGYLFFQLFAYAFAFLDQRVASFCTLNDMQHMQALENNQALGSSPTNGKDFIDANGYVKYVQRRLLPALFYNLDFWEMSKSSSRQFIWTPFATDCLCIPFPAEYKEFLPYWKTSEHAFLK